MGNTSSMLTQYDIDDVQEHCGGLFSQREIVSLYERFCQLDRNGKGFISADEFLSVPEFAVNPLSQRMLRMLDGLNFKDFVALLSAFSAKANLAHKVEYPKIQHICCGFLLGTVVLSLLVRLRSSVLEHRHVSPSTIYIILFIASFILFFCAVIFKLYDADGDGEVTRSDVLEVLHDLSGPFLSIEQRQQLVNRAFEESGYSINSPLTIQDFLKLWDKTGLKMEVEVPVD